MPVTDEEIKNLVTAIVDIPDNQDIGNKIADLFSRLAVEFDTAEKINIRMIAPIRAGIRASEKYKANIKGSENTLLIRLVENLTFVELKESVTIVMGKYRCKESLRTTQAPTLTL